MSGSLRQLIAARNREIMMEAALSFVMGVVYIVLTGGLIFWITWYFSHFWFGWGRGPIIAGLIAVVVYLLAATWSAWRRVDPFSAIAYDSDYTGTQKAGLSFALGVPVMDRHSIAGAGAALIAGPANIFESIADVRRRLPVDRHTLDAAHAVLQRAQRELKLTSDVDGQAVMTLHRLGLIKIRNVGANAVIMLTAMGIDAVRAGGARS